MSSLDHPEAVAEVLDPEEGDRPALLAQGALEEAADVEGLKALAGAIDEQKVAVGGERPGRDHREVGGVVSRGRGVCGLKVRAR